MTPPQLAADTPVLNVFEPVAVSRFVFSGHKLDVVVHHRRKGYFGKVLHVDKPLERQARLDSHLGAFREAHFVGVVFYLFEQSGCIQVLHYLLAHIEAVHTHIQRRLLRHCAIGVEDVDGFKVMGLAKHIVVHVVSRSHFQATRTELYVHVAVLYHINHAAHQWHYHLLALEPLVLGVLGIDAHSGVAHNGFGAGSGNHSITASLCIAMHHFAFSTGFAAHIIVGNIVAQIVELRFFFFVIHFIVAQCGLVLRVPVYHAQSAVNQSLVVEVAEHLYNAFAALFIHGESGATPVARSAELLELLQNDSAVLACPVPCVFQELFAGEVGLLDAFIGELVYYLGFGGDTCVVGSRHPKGILAQHACAAYQYVLNSVVEHVSHVQHAGYVGRRYHYGVGLSFVGDRLKHVVVHPVFVPFVFYFRWVVLGSQFVHNSEFYFVSL